MEKENENNSEISNKEETLNDENISKSEKKEELTAEDRLRETEDKLTRSYAELEIRKNQ